MTSGLILILLMGIFMTGLGGKILFTKGGVDWMYKNKIWKIDEFFGEKESRSFHRYIVGSAFFVGGLILLISSVLPFLIRP